MNYYQFLELFLKNVSESFVERRKKIRATFVASRSMDVQNRKLSLRGDNSHVRLVPKSAGA